LEVAVDRQRAPPGERMKGIRRAENIRKARKIGNHKQEAKSLELI
jgi:hypothetical protein